MIQTRWYRVNKKNPCNVCGRPDWCTYTEDARCCMRVESDKPMRNGGWLHKEDAPIYIAPSIRAAIQDPPVDVDGMWRKWFDKTNRERLDSFGIDLGVDTDALSSIGCAWAETAWAFPMRNAYGQVIGVRLRNECGQKWAVKGSKQGLFIPTDDAAITESGTLWLTEGPTDLAAALTIGLAAIGRPSALGQEDLILKYIDIWKARRLVIVTDNDEPDQCGRTAGMAGALRLQEQISIPSAILLPPTKDLRQFVNYGGDYLTAQSMLQDLVWSNPK